MAFLLAMAFIFIAQKLNKYGFNLLSAEISPVYIEKKCVACLQGNQKVSCRHLYDILSLRCRWKICDEICQEDR